MEQNLNNPNYILAHSAKVTFHFNKEKKVPMSSKPGRSRNNGNNNPRKAKDAEYVRRTQVYAAPVSRGINFAARTPRQQELVDAIELNDYVAVTGPAGCQPAGSKVLLTDGTWINIENLKVGDTVFSPQENGSVVSANIVDTFVYANRDIYEIKHSKGGSYLASHNHILPTLRSAKETGEANSHKENLFNNVNMTVDEYNSMEKSSRQDIKVYTTPAYELTYLSHELEPYALGTMISSAGIEQDAKVETRAPELVLNSGSLYAEKNNVAQFNTMTSTLQSTKTLSRFGMTSNFKFIPEEYKLGSINQRLQLLAGLIDASSSVDSYSSTSHKLLQDFADVVHSVGGYASKPKVSWTKGDSKSYTVDYSFAEYQPELMMKDANNTKWTNPRNHGFQTNLVENSTVYGFELDSVSKCYITDDYIVTHNTGKSTVLVACGVQMLMEGRVDKIIITRPIVEAVNENIGFLPGTLEEKADPYLVPIKDALNKFIGKNATESMFEEGRIEIVPFAFMRGRSLEDCLVICDEAQNANYEALKMIMSRIGKNSKLFLNGDLSQIDLRPKRMSGLDDVLGAIKLADIENFAFVEFTMEDCQRHPMVVAILNALAVFEESNNLPVKHSKMEFIGMPATPNLPTLQAPPMKLTKSGVYKNPDLSIRNDVKKEPIPTVEIVVKMETNDVVMDPRLPALRKKRVARAK